jgi:hypothetical protein
MRKTGKEMAQVNDGNPGGKEEIDAWVISATPRELQEYIHHIGIGPHAYLYQRARTALEIRLAEDAQKQADKLARFTFWLICFTVALVFIGVIQVVIMFSKL